MKSECFPDRSIPMEEFAAKGLAHFKVPRAWLALESFPLTASGKIRKVEVEKMFEAEAANSA